MFIFLQYVGYLLVFGLGAYFLGFAWKKSYVDHKYLRDSMSEDPEFQKEFGIQDFLQRTAGILIKTIIFLVGWSCLVIGVGGHEASSRNLTLEGEVNPTQSEAEEERSEELEENREVQKKENISLEKEEKEAAEEAMQDSMSDFRTHIENR